MLAKLKTYFILLRLNQFISIRLNQGDYFLNLNINYVDAIKTIAILKNKLL